MTDVATTKDLESPPASKSANVRQRRAHIGADQVLVQQLDVPVVAAAAPATPAAAPEPVADAAASVQVETESGLDAIPFVSTAKTLYSAGERLRIVFGADKPGWIHLYVIEPDGARKRLVRRAVDGERVQTATVEAVAPLGRHAIVAAYTEEEGFGEGRLARLSDRVADKGLRLLEEGPPAALAVREIRIVP